MARIEKCAVIDARVKDMERRKAMIDAADEVVFVWDGRSIEAEMRYAMDQGKSVVVANPARVKCGGEGR